MENILSKVEKLLKLADDNSNKFEAQSAMLRAQEILAKHDMTMEDVENENKDMKLVMEAEVIDPTGRIMWWKKQLALIISENFRCKTYINRTVSRTEYKRESTIIFFGLEQDVMVAKEVYKYAEGVIDRLAKSYVGKIYRSGKSTKGMRNEFIHGFLDGLRDKFKEQVEQNDWGLILVTDQLVIDHYNNKGLVKSSSSGKSPNFSGSSHARENGYKEGQNFANSTNKESISS